MWNLSATDTEPCDLDSQVRELLDQLPNDLAVWHKLREEYDIDLFCGWFMGSSNEGEEISAESLLRLGERGIRLGIDLYGPDADV